MKMIHEILEEAEKASGKNDKIKVLQDNQCRELIDILRGGMDDTIQFILPEGAPPLDNLAGKDSLHKKTKNFAYFVKGGPGERISSAEREGMFFDIVKKVHPKEAELLVLMKDKALIKKTNSAHYKGITKKLVSEAFPGLIRK